jgi:hypothetical protein
VTRLVLGVKLFEQTHRPCLIETSFKNNLRLIRSRLRRARHSLMLRISFIT